MRFKIFTAYYFLSFLIGSIFQALFNSLKSVSIVSNFLESFVLNFCLGISIGLIIAIPSFLIWYFSELIFFRLGYESSLKNFTWYYWLRILIIYIIFSLIVSEFIIVGLMVVNYSFIGFFLYRYFLKKDLKRDE